jgi:predicted DCC family thiol-disulfide oxidoreductase YuxK
MIDTERYTYMLFDGDCGICTSFSKTAEAVGTKKLFVIKPYQSFSTEDLVPFRLTYEQCDRKIQVIAHSGRVYTGAFVLNYFFGHYFPWSLLVVLVYAVPISLLIEMIGYAIVAKNRHHLSRWLGLKACSMNRRA